MECHCGSTVKPSSMYKHLQTKKHKSVVLNCIICFEDKCNFWKCKECKNIHCTDCHSQIVDEKCPICRESWITEIIVRKRQHICYYISWAHRLIYHLAFVDNTDKVTQEALKHTFEYLNTFGVLKDDVVYNRFDFRSVQ